MIDDMLLAQCRVLKRAVEACGADPMAGPLWELYIQLETVNVRCVDLPVCLRSNV